jgi:hypothetical protein
MKLNTTNEGISQLNTKLADTNRMLANVDKATTKLGKLAPQK